MPEERVRCGCVSSCWDLLYGWMLCLLISCLLTSATCFVAYLLSGREEFYSVTLSTTGAAILATVTVFVVIALASSCIDAIDERLFSPASSSVVAAA